jgi:AraC family transcriptional regulator
MVTSIPTLDRSKSLALQHVFRFGGPPALKSGLTRLRLNRALDYIQAHLDGEIHLVDLAGAVGLSPFHFAKLFKQSTGSTPHQYVLQRRLERATELLRSTELSLSEVALECGFADQSHFANLFRRFMGVTASQFRARL